MLTMSYLKTAVLLALLLMAAIVAVRVSGPTAGLIDTYRVHVSLMTRSTSQAPGPFKPVKPVVRVRYLEVPPKLYCQP